MWYNYIVGVLAQLIERCIRIAEVRSLNLLHSTKYLGSSRSFFVNTKITPKGYFFEVKIILREQGISSRGILLLRV